LNDRAVLSYPVKWAFVATRLAGQAPRGTRAVCNVGPATRPVAGV
jgi:hypothetical protein